MDKSPSLEDVAKALDMTPEELEVELQADDVQALEAAEKETETLRAKVQDMREKITALESAATEKEADFQNRLARIQADTDNFRKRKQRETEEASQRAILEVVGRLVPIIDNLERALLHQHDEGVDMVRKELLQLLSSYGVEAFDPLGEAFDPEQHDAMMVRPGGTENQVAEVFAKGYRTEQLVLRPAQVVVHGG